MYHRGQIATQRAMGAIFARKYGLEGILKGGFPGTPTRVGVDYGVLMSGIPVICPVSGAH